MSRRLPGMLLLLWVLTIAPLCRAAEQGGTVLRDSELRSEPYTDTTVLGKVKAKSTVMVIKRQGGWYQVRDAAGRSGWLRMSALRLGELRAGGDSGVGETIQFLSTGRSGASGVTVATGIRGLDSADVANATPNHQAVKRLAAYQSSATQAKSFAAGGKLKSRELAYMEAKSKSRESFPGIGEGW